VSCLPALAHDLWIETDFIRNGMPTIHQPAQKLGLHNISLSSFGVVFDLRHISQARCSVPLLEYLLAFEFRQE
jgi:hypothetical protein